MTVAALVLAAALMTTPVVPRHRVAARRTPRRTPRRGWGLTGALGCAVAVVLTAPVTVSLACGVVVSTLAMRRRGSRAQARRACESVALQGALGVMVGELRVGAHPVAAFETAATDVGGTTASAFLGVAARARLGADVADGLLVVAATSTLPAHWRRLSACWALAESQGLSIVALVDAARRDVAERERFVATVAAGMAGARATAAILAGLPVLGVALGQLIGAEPLRFLLSGGAGGWLLLTGVVLACAGLAWSDRITSRVLR